MCNIVTQEVKTRMKDKIKLCEVIELRDLPMEGFCHK